MTQNTFYRGNCQILGVIEIEYFLTGYRLNGRFSEDSLASALIYYTFRTKLLRVTIHSKTQQLEVDSRNSYLQVSPKQQIDCTEHSK